MVNRRLKIYMGLQSWTPPLYRARDWNAAGEYTKEEAISILTDALMNFGGRYFHPSTTLRMEEELTNICCTLDGCTDVSVYMKYSMIPAIIGQLTPESYYRYLRKSGCCDDYDVRVSDYGLDWLLEELDVLGYAELTVVDSSRVLIRAKDIDSLPIEYSVEMPWWLKKLIEAEVVTMGDVRNLFSNH